jgi:hypothetical protein
MKVLMVAISQRTSLPRRSLMQDTSGPHCSMTLHNIANFMTFANEWRFNNTKFG